jgi:cytochrome c oxidase subunit III
MLIAAYFNLRGHSPDWPPNASPPMMRWGVFNTAVLLLSVTPNTWYKRAAVVIAWLPIFAVI